MEKSNWLAQWNEGPQEQSSRQQWGAWQLQNNLSLHLLNTFCTCAKLCTIFTLHQSVAPWQSREQNLSLYRTNQSLTSLGRKSFKKSTYPHINIWHESKCFWKEKGFYLGTQAINKRTQNTNTCCLLTANLATMRSVSPKPCLKSHNAYTS